MRIAVVDAYGDEGRVSLKAAGCTPAGELYARVIAQCDPAHQVDVLFADAASRLLPEAVGAGDYDGVVWTGSNLTIHRPDDQVRAQVELARTLVEAGVPCFGSCWAAQLAVVTFGGACAAHPRGREFGIVRAITLNDQGRAHPLFEGKPTVFDSYASHEDHITQLPSGATLLASNEWSPVQALEVRHGRGAFWAVQYHPEYDLREVARLGVVRQAQLIAQGDFADEDAAAAYWSKLESLYESLSRSVDSALAAELGVGSDLLDRSIRHREIINWLRSLTTYRAAR